MRRRNEILVGVVIVLGVAVTVFGTLWFQGRQFGRNLVLVDALFSDVGQLALGNNVKLRGVSIGQVSDISVEPGGNAVRVRMRIDSGVSLPGDAVVLLAPESMFGDWQAEIVPRGRFPQFEYFRSAGEGELAGYALPDISRLTAAADQISRNLAIITDRVEVAFTEETAQNIADAIGNIEDVSQRLTDLVQQQGQAIQEVVAEVQSSAEEIGSAARSARTTFEQVGTVLDRGDLDSLAVDARIAARNLRELSDGLRTSGEDLDGTLARVDTTFARLNRIASGIEAGEGALGRLVGDSSLVLRAEGALEQLELLLADFRANPRKYVRLSIF